MNWHPKTPTEEAQLLDEIEKRAVSARISSCTIQVSPQWLLALIAEVRGLRRVLLTMDQVLRLRAREKHCWSNVDGTVKVTRYDGGGGPYIVINATEWSEDSVDELCDRIRAMWKRLEFAPEGKP
ncbi:MAG TPA: hypothetical protein PLU99_15615 [Phycisphaerae bacterium]|nr:hypothetical protein [Phycisphaerae bacterium]